jgi:hypothetical protein
MSTLPEQLQTAAEACVREEEVFRRDSERRLQALVNHRVAAYRRYYLLKAMAAAAGDCETRDRASAAALDAALTETGWNEDDRAYNEVCGQLAGVAEMVSAAQAAENTTAADHEARAAIEAMLRFETWYRDRFGSGFLDLLETERGFLPVVDF